MALPDGYERLVAIARREAELISEGRWEELPALEAARRAATDGLPEQPPVEAMSLLAEAHRLVFQNVADLRDAIETKRSDLAMLGRGRKAVAGYGSAGVPSAGRLVDGRG
jgi:hypothetical protein